VLVKDAVINVVRYFLKASDRIFLLIDSWTKEALRRERISFLENLTDESLKVKFVRFLHSLSIGMIMSLIKERNSS